MKLFKFFIVTIFIYSFLANSVSSKLISLCIISHNVEKLYSEKTIQDKPCHSSTKEKKKNQLCTECDCYLNNLAENISTTIFNINFLKSNVDKFIISKYLVDIDITDPPPKKLF
tara:strand:- start:1040 stop:1381 length:342 start_codon:yes stop_codon:yes gene_type:complete